MELSKKDFYKKPLKKCPCCKWPGAIHEMGKRKWLSIKIHGHRERLSDLESEKTMRQSEQADERA